MSLPLRSRAPWRTLVAVALASDVFAIVAAFAGTIRLFLHWHLSGNIPRYQSLVTLMSVLAIFGFLSQGLYSPRNLLVGAREFVGVVKGCAYGFIVYVVAGF